MKLATAVSLLATASTIMAQSLPSQPKADVIFLHGNIYTGVADTSSFHANPRTEALAVRDGRVAAVGRDDEILRLKGSATSRLSPTAPRTCCAMCSGMRASARGRR